jgi:predicted pyridoxine 5'-phosphate oxidase superfamily flavin-nucleotide-binding protein
VVGVFNADHLAIPTWPATTGSIHWSKIVVSPGVGMRFVIPGLDETLRVNGEAVITTDPEVLARLTVHEKTPRTAIVEKRLESSYRSTIWQVGGIAPG